MTNGAFVFFKNEKERKECQIKLNSFYIYNFKVFDIKKISKVSLFYKIKIKSFQKISLNENNNLNNCLKQISYVDNKKVTNQNNKKKINYFFIKYFFNNINFIKTTGVHSKEGVLFYKNIFIGEKKKIENHKIFNLILNHFNI